MGQPSSLPSYRGPEGSPRGQPLPVGRREAPGGCSSPWAGGKPRGPEGSPRGLLLPVGQREAPGSNPSPWAKREPPGAAPPRGPEGSPGGKPPRAAPPPVGQKKAPGAAPPPVGQREAPPVLLSYTKKDKDRMGNLGERQHLVILTAKNTNWKYLCFSKIRFEKQTHGDSRRHLVISFLPLILRTKQNESCPYSTNI